MSEAQLVSIASILGTCWLMLARFGRKEVVELTEPWSCRAGKVLRAGWEAPPTPSSSLRDPHVGLGLGSRLSDVGGEIALLQVVLVGTSCVLIPC